MRATVPVSSEPLVRVGVSHCDAVECAVVPRPMRRQITTWILKFNLRVGESLHRRLATRAAEEHLSLNQYVVRRLSEAS